MVILFTVGLKKKSRHKIPKTFTLKTGTLPREIKEDLTRWRVNNIYELEDLILVQ